MTLAFVPAKSTHARNSRTHPSMVGRGRSCRVTSQVFQPGEPFWLTPSRVKGTVLFLSIPWKVGKWFRMHSHVSVHMEMSGPHRAFAENRLLEMGDGFTGCNHGFESV